MSIHPLTSDGQLAGSDPELAEIVDRFAADVVAEAPLEPRVALLVQLAALISLDAQPAYDAMLGAALDAGVTPVEAKEVLYRAAPYAGLARTFAFVGLTNRVLAARGVELPLPPQATTTTQTRADLGRAVQKQIVGDERVDAMHAAAPADEQHIHRFLAAHCFGDHYTRNGLDIPTRELITLALLAALGGADPQVGGHVQANLHVGNDRATMIAVLTRLLPWIGYPRTLNALRAVDQHAPAPSEEETP